MSELQANTDCELFGFGSLQNSRRDVVTILDSQFCDSNFPHIFCSRFFNETHETCSAIHASPVVCGNLIAGFLINDGSCSNTDNLTTLEYHSSVDFTDWINLVTKTDIETENKETR